MVDVLMEFAIVRQDSWERPVNRRCVPTDVLDMDDAMVSPASASATLVMEVLIALNRFVQIVRMETVEMMRLACAKLVGLETPVERRLVTRTVKSMAVNAILETVCVHLAWLVCNVKSRSMFAQADALEMEFVTSGASNATAMMDLVETIAAFDRAQGDATNPMVVASMELVTVHPTSLEAIAVLRIAQMPVPVMASVTAMLILATVSLVGLVTTAAS
jgi:hypothetical protein